MSSRAVSGEFDVSLAFFKNADHCKITVNTADRICDYTAALVADKEKLNSAPFQLIYDFRRTVTCPFLCA